MGHDIRVLLLDDHPMVLDGLGGFLEQQAGFCVVGRHTSQEAALASLEAAQPHVAIVDIKVGGGFGFAFGVEALRRLPTVKLLFLTGFDDDVFLEKAFEVGGLGFLLKSEPLSELAAAVHQVARGDRYVSPGARVRGSDAGKPVALGGSRLALLTPREREVVRYVSMGKSAKEISRILKISAWTVTNHKANVMAKLGIHNQVGLARFAVETGLTNNI